MEPKKDEEKKPEEAKKPAVKRLVRVKALRPLLTASGRIINAGQIGEVEEDQVAELTKETKGHFTFGGERYGQEAENGRANMKRAELVQDQPQA